jgi:hypothetical protein
VKELIFWLFAEKVLVGKERKIEMHETRVFRVLDENLKPQNSFPFLPFTAISRHSNIYQISLLTLLIVFASDHFGEESP